MSTIDDTAQDAEYIFFFGASPWTPQDGTSAGIGSKADANFGIGNGVTASTITVTNADAFVVTGLRSGIFVDAGSALNVTNGNAVTIADGTVTTFINSPYFRQYLANFNQATPDASWLLLLDGHSTATAAGTINGDVVYSGTGSGLFSNFGITNGSVIATSGYHYVFANAWTVNGSVNLTADAYQPPPYPTFYDAPFPYIVADNNGLITNSVSLSAANVNLYNISTGHELDAMFGLISPAAVDQAVSDDAGLAALIHSILENGAPAGAVRGEIDGSVNLTGDFNRLFNLGYLFGGATLTAGTTPLVANYADGGFRGFNQVLNAYGAELTGGLTLNGGSTLLQDGLLFKSSVINLGLISGPANINGASTFVLNGAKVNELTDSFFTVGGATAQEEIALLRADISTGIDRGQINGNITFGDAGHAFLNLGRVNGTVTFGAGDDIFSNVGEVTGNVDLGGGNDTAFVGASAIFGGTLSGGTGTSNVVTIFGSGSFDPSKFQNFQTMVFDVQSGGSATITPTGAISSSFSVQPGVTLDLTHGGSTASTTAGRTIGVSGTVNGDVDLGAGQNTVFTLNQNGSLSGVLNGGSSGTSVLNLNLTGTIANNISGFQMVTVDSPDATGLTKLTGNIVVLDTLSLVGGSLRLNGSLTSPNVNVAAGGVLGGGGTVTGSVTSTGTVSPGNSIGTLSIIGDYSEGGMLDIETSPQKSLGTFRADKVNVTGDIYLNSGSQLFVTAETLNSIKEVTTPDQWPGSATVSIIDFTGSRTGTFTTVGDDFVFLTSGVEYDDANHQVLLTLAIAPVDVSMAANNNETSMLNALNQNLGSLGKLWGLAMDEVASLTGEVGTSSSSLVNTVSNQFMGFVGQSGQMPGSYVISATDTPKRVQVASIDETVDLSSMQTEVTSAKIWVAPWGARSDHRGNNGLSGYDADAYGLAGGYVAYPSDMVEVGLSGGYGHTRADGMASNGAVDGDSIYLGAHVARHDGPLTTHTSVAYGYHMFDQSRVAVVGGTPELISANYSANEVVGQLRVSYALTSGVLTLRPYVGTSYSLLFREGFTEQGSTLGSNLTFDSETFHHGDISYGIDMTAKMAMSDGELRPYLGIGANYAYGDLDGRSSVRFAGTGTSFSISGAEQDRWQIVMRAGFALHLSSGTDFGLGYTGAFGSSETNQTAQVSLNYSF